MIELVGAVLLAVSGAAAGSAAADEIKQQRLALQSVEDMLAQMMIMLEFEASTVQIMLSELRKGSAPEFIMRLPENADPERICEAIKRCPDGLTEQDVQKLCTLFGRLGSADKLCEQQRIAGAAAYFAERRKKCEPECRRKEKLAKSLGLLGGIFFAVMLL